jgi:phage-related protein
VKSFPAGVQDDIGYAHHAAQLGGLSVRAKPLHGLGDRVMETAAYDASGTAQSVRLHKAGIAAAKPEMDLIRQRLKQLKSEVKNAEKSDPRMRA